MEDNKFQREVLDRLMRLETKIDLQDYKGLSEKTDLALNKAISNEEKIKKLESNQSWIVKLVIGAVISGILAFIYKM